MSLLVPAAQWRLFQGHVLGLQQASMLGSIRVDVSVPVRLDAIEAVVNGALLKPFEVADDSLPAALRLMHRLAYWLAEIQRQARIAVSHHHVVTTPEPAPVGAAGLEVQLAVPLASRAGTPLALNALISIINRCQAHPDAAPPAAAFAADFSRLAESLKPYAAPGFNRLHLIDAAFRLDVPVHVIDGQLIRLGQGARSRLVESTLTEQTPAIGHSVAQDKWLTARVLGEIGFPVPTHGLVGSAAEAVELARKLGYPVVVKPANLDQGLGVSANLRSDTSVRAAYEEARPLSPRILVEKHFDGFGHRLTLYKGQLIAALRRIPGGVQGDGQHSVQELLALQLQLPEVRRNLKMGRVSLDAQALAMLAEQGLSRDSVPPDGTFIALRRKDNISAGGRATPLQAADIHPDNLDLAVRACKALNLDLAGVDLLIADIAVSWRVAGGLICEINTRPQFGPGPEHDNYLRLLQAMMGPEVRIPVHLRLCGAAQTEDTTRQMETFRLRTGCHAWSQGSVVWRDGAPHAHGFANGLAAARAALGDKDIHSLAIGLTVDEIVRRGLPVNRLASISVSPTADWPEAARARLNEALWLTGFERNRVHFEEGPP